MVERNWTPEPNSEKNKNEKVDNKFWEIIKLPFVHAWIGSNMDEIQSYTHEIRPNINEIRWNTDEIQWNIAVQKRFASVSTWFGAFQSVLEVSRSVSEVLWRRFIPKFSPPSQPAGLDAIRMSSTSVRPDDENWNFKLRLSVRRLGGRLGWSL